MILTSRRPQLASAFERAFRAATQETVGEAKENAPVGMGQFAIGRVKGQLRASIAAGPVVVMPSGEGRTLRTTIGSPLRYAAMREFGGDIFPVRRPRLVWRDAISGRWYSSKHVHQRPGGPRQRRPYTPYLRPAVEGFPKRMDEFVQAWVR